MNTCRTSPQATRDQQAAKAASFFQLQLSTPTSIFSLPPVQPKAAKQ